MEERPNKFITTRGYVRLRSGEHKGKLEHRAVMEEKLGRPLSKGEIVDHDNNRKTDNDDRNLIVTTQAEHARRHGQEYAPLRKRNAKGQFDFEDEYLLPRLNHKKRFIDEFNRGADQ